MPRLLALGECMVELAAEADGRYRRGFAGDTFNAGWYARRLLPADWTVAYGTCVGDDPVSDEMLAFMTAEGIVPVVRRVPGRSVGLYMISLTGGERSFAYWRDNSAARSLAEDSRWLDEVTGAADAIWLSGITLAILPPDGRVRLCDALARARARGAEVAFDTNLRPRLWEDAGAMRAGLMAGAAVADIVLPGFDEDGPLFKDATPQDTIARYRNAGATCVCVKDGPGPVHLWAGGAVQVLAPVPATPVDSTAAGDSFGGAFLAAWLTGATPGQAAQAGMAIAAQVIAQRGALVEVTG